VLLGKQEYGFCSRATDVRPALWSAYDLQSLVVDLIHESE
jgi:hypothetical protein